MATTTGKRGKETQRNGGIHSKSYRYATDLSQSASEPKRRRLSLDTKSAFLNTGGTYSSCGYLGCCCLLLACFSGATCGCFTANHPARVTLGRYLYRTRPNLDRAMRPALSSLVEPLATSIHKYVYLVLKFTPYVWRCLYISTLPELV